MRSVVVVLPASMWAMMPMLRVSSSGNSRLAIVRSLPSSSFELSRGGGPNTRARTRSASVPAGTPRQTWSKTYVSDSSQLPAGEVLGEGVVLVRELGEPGLDDVADRH